MLQTGREPVSSLKTYAALLGRYLRPHWPWAAGLAALILGNIALQLVNPQIMREFLDTAQAGGPADVLFRAGLLFLAVAFAQQIVSVLATYVGENVAWKSTNTLRADLTEHCLRLDMSFHNAHKPGEMIERIDGDVTALSNFFSQFVIQILGNALLLVGILALLFREDWRVGLTLGVFAMINLVVLVRLRNIGVPHWAAERQASANLFGFLEERLAGTEDIRANGGKAYTMHHFYQLMRELLRRSLKAGMMVNILYNAMFFFFALGTAAAFAVGAWLFYQEVLTIGSVYIIFAYTNMLERPIDQIMHQVEDLQKAGAGIARIEELSRIRSRLSDRSRERLPAGALAVEFQDVSFCYKDLENGSLEQARPGERVLHELSFELQPGTVLGLLGRTGSGKTTLTRLLFRLYDPEEGMVRLGNHGSAMDLRQVSLSNVRQRVGMVTQNIQLFHATVRDNLTFFDDRIPDERILEVLRAVGMEAWLRALPSGLDTVLESGGSGLSAGEAQLLAFTRIFLQDPGLVILDEASSRLDPATEHLIERAVDRLVQGRTAIIIAHRLGTVQRADEILILDRGRIVEHGPRAALASDPASRFYGLLQTGLEEVLA
jgi:ATP-binding cassette subfamily B protein